MRGCLPLAPPRGRTISVMRVFDQNQGQWVDIPDRPFHVRIPFLRNEVPAGDVVAAATHALGVPPCTPCEERRKRMNQKVVFSPWGT